MKYLWNEMDNNDINELTSYLASISTLNLSNFVKNDFENTSVLLYNYMKKTKHYTGILEYIINTLHTQSFFVFNEYKIFVSHKSLFKLILLMSIKHYEEIFNKKCKSVTTKNIESIILLILESYLGNILYIPILRILHSLLKKYKNIIRHELCIGTFMFAQRISLCPIEGFKYYSQIISKHVLPYINSEYIHLFSDISLLPLRGLETSELIPFFSKKSYNEGLIKDVVFKVLDMFSNNLESREGGFLYKTLMFMHFDDWKRLVWSYFSPKMIRIDFEGEFIQSILKYWIPITLNTYKIEFYNHIYETHVPMYIKGQILLAMRKKQYFDTYNCKMILNLNNLILNKTYRTLGLQILSTFNKRTMSLNENELQLLKLFLYSQVCELDYDEVKYIWSFLSHLTVILTDMQSSNNVDKANNDLIYSYMTLLNNISNYGFNLLKSDQPELGAQILNIFWKLYQGEINVRYKVDRDINFVKCTTLHHKESCEKFSKTIENVLEKSNFNYIEVTNLACYISNYMKFDYSYLIKYVNSSKNNISIKTSESVKNLAKLVISKNSTGGNEQLYYKLHNEAKRILSELFCDNLFKLEDIFEEVLLFDILLEVIKCQIKIIPSYYQEIVGLCIPAVKHILSAPERNSNIKLQIKDTFSEHIIHGKTKKIIEAFLNNILQFIMETLNYMELKSVMTFLTNIIESSNMRRPTTTSAQILILASKKNYDDNMKNTDLDNFKILLLSDVLSKLLQVPLDQYLTIRRNPESRLIVHALCISDKTANKATLKWGFRELLNILSNKNNDSTLSSSLHCIETLISDNMLYNDTFEFIPEVFSICVKLFDQKSWTVRNANIQLAKALIDRFHGVLVGYNNRPKSIDDLFSIFPSLAVSFFQTLSNDQLTDSAVIVMQFFSESQFRKKVFDDDYLDAIRESFLILFIKIIKNNSNHYGIFAVRSYVSLCLEENIPIIIQDVVNCIIENMTLIKQNHTLTNFILLLNELYYKYKVFLKSLPKQPNNHWLIQKSFEDLKKYFSYINSKQFDLLLVKVQTVKGALNSFSNTALKLSNWDHRLWQHNYISYICVHCKENEIAIALENILSHSVLDCIQIKILEVLLDRYCLKHFSKSTIQSIIECLIKKMFQVKDIKSYLLWCYFKLIFCFIKHCVRENHQGLLYVRKFYGTFNCLYKCFIVILLLSQSRLEDNDKLFFKQTIKRLKDLKICDIETAKVVSEMLPFLFKTTFCVCDKYFLFKLAVFLIMEYNLWDFVEFISNCDVPTANFAMIRILDYKILLDNLKDSSVTLKFVTEVFQYANQKATDKLKHCINLTYYVEEENSYVDSSTINKIVLKFLIEYNKATSNNERFEFYKTVTECNKK